MSVARKAFLAGLCSVLMAFAHAVPAQQESGPPGADHPGRQVLLRSCFQCHNDAMWRDQYQDRRAWEEALYRMVGRGALWTADEIRVMADYLGTTHGPQPGKPDANSPAR